MSPRRLFLRVEGHRAIGLGHFSRCLALAEMLRGEWKLVFAMQQADEFVHSQIQALGAEFLLLPDANPASLAGELKPGDLVYLDGYAFTTADESCFRSRGAIVVTADDFQHRSYQADVVLNYCGGIDTVKFDIAPHTRLCLGPQYLILRSEFLGRAALPLKARSGGRVFVTAGGTDPQNLGGEFLSALTSLDLVKEIHFLSSEMNQHLPALRGKQWPRPVHFHTGQSGAQIAAQLDESHLAVSSASVSAWEVAAVHVPLLIMETVDNQREVFRFLTQSGMALGFDSSERLKALAQELLQDSQAQRAIMERQAHHLNGESAETIRQLFRSLSS